ncbi:MAG: hypothetical protein ACPLRA_01550, partial [Candidatus Saccharicenans sp.]
MTEDQSRRQDYYQTIARAFLKHQTSMFFLPPRDLALITEWEKLKIPLEAIIEGIERTFSRQMARKKKRKIYSLSLCEKEVLKAYSQFQERLVGKQAAPFDRAEKIKKINQEIFNFLKNLPSELTFLEEPLTKAQAILEMESPDERALEELDEEIDRLLWIRSPERDKESCWQEIRIDYPGKTDQELSEIQRTRLIKNLRNKHKIPYLSL